MDQLGTPSTKVFTITESKALVDGFLMPLFMQLTEDARRISPHYETLWQDIQKLYSAGGKRLRSYMTFLTYEAYSGKSYENILPAAAAQELLHMAMLIHDDIIDRDDIRYGVKNIAREYMDHYEELLAEVSDRRHYANSAAILAGDLLISESYVLISETQANPAAVLASQKLLSKAVFQVVGGELLDTEAAFRGADSADPLTIAEQKTASYSFVSPFLMGAILAEADQLQQDILQKLGEQLGIAYQLRDDILGVFGDEEKTGKSTSGDLKEGKRTLLLSEFRKLATEAQRQEFDAQFGNHEASTEDIARMKELFVESGAKASIEELIAAYQEHAHRLVDALDIQQVHRDAFTSLIELCIRREK